MPKSKARDNAYFEQRLLRDFPAIHADYLAGKYPNLHAALVASGLKRPRTRLQELKNAWGAATKEEKKQFVIWIKAQALPRPAASGAKPLAVDRRLETWASHRICEIMDHRKMKLGQVMDELGFGRRDASLGNALSKGTRLKPSMITALEKWVATNAKS